MTTPVQITSGDAELEPQPYGVTVKVAEDMARVQVTCQHQSGLIYAVPGDRSWVCSDELRPAHAMAGFFRELLALGDPRVEVLMQQWGLYYRSLPLDVETEDGEQTPS
jgi:hypothetical protein